MTASIAASSIAPFRASLARRASSAIRRSVKSRALPSCQRIVAILVRDTPRLDDEPADRSVRAAHSRLEAADDTVALDRGQPAVPVGWLDPEIVPTRVPRGSRASAEAEHLRKGEVGLQEVGRRASFGRARSGRGRTARGSGAVIGWPVHPLGTHRHAATTRVVRRIDDAAARAPHWPVRGGAPGRIRTCDLPLRRRLLCPLSYGDALASAHHCTRLMRARPVGGLVLPAARPQRRRGGRRMSPGGLFAGTGPDGGDGPSCAPDVTKVPVE